MPHDPIVTELLQKDLVVHDASNAAERPAPSRQDEQVADGVFSREQEELAGVVLSVQAGLMITQHLIHDAIRPALDEEEKEKEDPHRRKNCSC